MNNETILETKGNLKNGQQFCPNCGATEIYFDSNVGKLFCPYCDSVFEGKKFEETDVSKIEGTIIGSGAQKINENFNNIVTMRCNGCGAEVVVDTNETTQKRCHWCRGILSINERIPNGTIPDAILPFKIKKEEAKKEIDKFVQSRRFFALPIFKREYKLENVMGVYLPYMLVDANTLCDFDGEGEKCVRQYGSGKSRRYDAKVYRVRRKFNMTIQDLTIETSKDKLDKYNSKKTNNIINSIMPFDTENCIRFQSNYLTGYTSEKRDTNIEELKYKTETQFHDIARHRINNDLKDYDRGIRWQKENMDIVGTRWISAYLPVWIYSYYEKRKKQLHYIAVNGRTKEMMGSIPINKPLLFLVSAIIETIAILISLKIMTELDVDRFTFMISFLLCTTGFIYYRVIFNRYRNENARHTYEKETKTSVELLAKDDIYVKMATNLKSEKIAGQNNTRIDGDKIKIVDEKNFIDITVDKLSK